MKIKWMKWNGKGENENKWNEIEYEWMERNFMGIRDELDEINGIWSNEMRINEDGNNWNEMQMNGNKWK